jgi:Transposase C of IS166 homeodomain
MEIGRDFRLRIWLNRIVMMLPDPLPTDLAAAHAMILAQREMLAEARTEATVWALEIERLKLLLAKARREKFGQSSERGKQLIEQLELAIADLGANLRKLGEAVTESLECEPRR